MRTSRPEFHREFHNRTRRRLRLRVPTLLALAALVACSEGEPTLPDGTVASASRRDASQSGIDVSPAADTLRIGESVKLTATLQTSKTWNKRSWTTSDAAVASVDKEGVVTGVGVGTATIKAQSGPNWGTALITVVDSAAPAQPSAVPASVVKVSGDGQTAVVGATLASPLVVKVVDKNGAAVAGAMVTWATASGSLSPSSVLSDAQGQARSSWTVGTTAGTVQATATVSGLTPVTFTASVTSAPSSSGGLANECATPRSGWIWCDDFDQDRLSRYFEVTTDNGSFGRVAGVGADGSTGMRARWSTAGQVAAGNLKLAFGRTPSSYMRPVDAGTANYREIYWRVYVRNQPGWTGGGGYKFTRAAVFANSSWAEAMIAHVWTGGTSSTLTLDPASGTDDAGNLKTTTYNDFNNLRWLGAVTGKTPIFDAAHVGQWYCVESHVRLNDAGQSNGVFEFWVNGALEARSANLNWLGSFSAYGINSILLENYWNTGAPQPEERYFDNFVVSTQPIGCGSSSSPPPTTTISSVSVKPDSAAVAVGSTVTLNATVTDGSGSSVGGATWTSLSSGIATVSSTGVVKGMAQGRAGIVAAAGGKADTAFVSVTQQTASKVTVSPKTASIATGATVQLSATVYDATGTAMSGATKTWTSVSPSIATVSSSGLVTGVAAGTAKVVVAAAANVTDTAVVTVTAPSSPPPSGSYTKVIGQDWSTYASDSDLKSKNLFTFNGGDASAYYQLVSDPTFGKAVRITFPQNSGSGGSAPRLEQYFPAIDKMWYRWRMKFTPGWTTVGPDPSGWADSYKIAFWLWNGYWGRGELQYSNATQYITETTAQDPSTGQWLNYSRTPLAGSASDFGSETTEWSDGEWWEFVVYYEKTGATTARQYYWRRRLTNGGQVANNPWVFYGYTWAGSTTPQVSGITLGGNKNKNNPTTMYLTWGPFEVVDGSKYPNPFNMPNVQ
ncbi:MAG TPA: Ig-like domain-containing protein [Longimicrobiales bacterium]|nr:Ig-like domain-containing protein [Longimicrobiales bacterium]